MLPVFFLKRLYWRIAIVVTVVIAATAVLFSVHFVKEEAELLLEDHVDQASKIAELVSLTLDEPDHRVSRHLNEIATFRHVVAIHVLNEDKSYRYSTLSANAGTQSPLPVSEEIPETGPVVTRTEDRLLAWHPVLPAGGGGWVVVDFSLTPIVEFQRRALEDNIIDSFGVVIIAAGIILLALRRPITEMDKTARFAGELAKQRGAQMDVYDGVSEISDVQKALNETSRTIMFQEAKLAAAGERLQSIVDNTVDAIITIDRGGIVQTFNRAAERIFGYEASEVVGTNVSRLMPSPHRELHDTYLSNFLRTGTAKIIGIGRETAGQRKDGTTFPFDLSVSEVVSGDEHYFVGICRDMTEKKRAEARLRRAQRMQSVGELAGGIAHEFNNLLTTIGGYARMANAHPDNQSRVEDSLKEVIKAADQAADLTAQLLAFSRRSPISAGSVEIGNVIVELEGLLPAIKRSDIRTLFDIRDESLRIKVDKAQLVQGLLNLVLNARDAMPEGGQITILTRAIATEELPGKPPKNDDSAKRYIAITITDTGDGMDNETMTRIFEPFFTTKEQGRGTGLGLSIVYGMVEQSKGLIDVKSELGRGTTFTLYFPETMEPDEATVEEAQGEIAAGSETVLVAEDEKTVRAYIATTLREAGYTVIEARDGEEALGLFLDNMDAISISIIDVVMPKIGGLDVARGILQAKPNSKLIYVSGDAKSVQAFSESDDELAYLRKPVSPESLLKTIRRVLDA
ncbi:MAG: PAS domain S-box protein [Rhodospirillales bacterium]|nr:PAS domain S-box protein [Rhodospirillales bacterium]MCW8971173.1 PAS domain S-box protein [Rhodospirillales bacterium]